MFLIFLYFSARFCGELNQRCVGLHVKSPLLLSKFNQNCNQCADLTSCFVCSLTDRICGMLTIKINYEITNLTDNAAPRTGVSVSRNAATYTGQRKNVDIYVWDSNPRSHFGGEWYFVPQTARPLWSAQILVKLLKYWISRKSFHRFLNSLMSTHIHIRVESNVRAPEGHRVQKHYGSTGAPPWSLRLDLRRFDWRFSYLDTHCTNFRT